MRDSDDHGDDRPVDDLLRASVPRIVTDTPGINGEVRRLALAHGLRRRPGVAGRAIAAAVVLVGVALGGAAVGAATAAPSSGAGGRPGLPVERNIVMSKVLESGTCDVAWTLTVREHVDGYVRQLDAAAAYLTELDISAIAPDPEWLDALNDPDALALTPQRTTLEKEGNAFVMAVAKSAWDDGGVSDEVIALETITVCTEVAGR